MLDFYSIPDGAQIPGYPDEARYLGSIDMAQHRDLCLMFEAFGVKGPPPYHEDSRYISSAVRALQALLEAKAQHKAPENGASKRSLNSFLSILKKAASKECGLIAFCD